MSFKYRIIDGEIILCDYICQSISEFPTSVIIPELINNYPVTKISGSLFAYKYPLVEVVIPDSIKHMDYYSFYDCKNLTAINGIKLERGINIINNRFIFDCNMVYKIAYCICNDYITIYGDDKMYFINNRIFTDNLTEII